MRLAWLAWRHFICFTTLSVIICASDRNSSTKHCLHGSEQSCCTYTHGKILMDWAAWRESDGFDSVFFGRSRQRTFERLNPSAKACWTSCLWISESPGHWRKTVCLNCFPQWPSWDGILLYFEVITDKTVQMILLLTYFRKPFNCMWSDNR